MHAFDTESGMYKRTSSVDEARRRRQRTKNVLFVCLFAVVTKLVLNTAFERALTSARLNNEMCWPLFQTSAVRAIVLAGDQPQTLWFPSYAPDPSATEFLRTKEHSVFCPMIKQRIRQKSVDIKHGIRTRTLTLKDKQAVCVMHVTDFFNTKNCSL
jgi:hypothetical protein